MVRRLNNLNPMSMKLTAFIIIAAICFCGNAAHGVGLTYAEADPEAGTPNVGPLTAFETTSSDTSNFWGKRTDFGANATAWQSGVAEDSPELTQTVSGLTPGNSYDMYVVYWTDNDENWVIKSGLTPGSLTTYGWTGTSGLFPVAGSVAGAPAALTAWDSPPPVGPAAAGTQLYTQRVTATGFGTDDPLVMMLGKAGTAVADGSGNINVYIDDVANAGGANRAWFDGVAYKPTEAGALTPTATLDRDSGALTLNNLTTTARDIKAIRIETAAGSGGGLNATAWNSVASSNASWTVTDPATPASTPFTNNLTENGGATTITLGAGGSLSFGNVWNRSPYDQLVIHLTLSDDTLAVLTPQVTGAARVMGDLDGNGSFDTLDYQTLMSFIHTNLGTTLRVEAYRKGDMTGDGAVNFSDFAAFRNAYDLAHGAGAFEQMAGQVPEPGSVALCLVAGAFAYACLRRRRGVAAALCAMTLSVLTIHEANAVPLIAVDINERDAAAQTEGTQAGFESFLMPGTTTATTPITNVLAGYTVTLAPFDDGLDENNVTAGVQNTVGAFDDRDRPRPVNGGAFTFAQMYDDFVFAGGSTGPTGGIDISVSGGSLQPNRAYVFSLYSYDNVSGGNRTANWFDATNTLSPIFSTLFAGANANDPTNNDQYKVTGLAETNATGVLTIQGRNTTPNVAAGGVNPGVFVNGFEINEFTGLTLEVDTSTGATRFLNEQAGSLSLGYYEIRSISGALNTGGWDSLDDKELSDPVGTGWDEATGSSANILSEGNLQGQTSIAAANGLTLGNAFTIAAAQDLRFLYAEFGDNSLRPGFVKYISTGIAGDYNDDNKVDAADYVVWRKDPASHGGPGGYNTWRANFGTGTGSGTGLGGNSAVPEPTGIALAVVALAAGYVRRRSR